MIRAALIAAVLLSLFVLIPAISPSMNFRLLLTGEASHFIIIAIFFVFLHFLFEPLRWYLYIGRKSSESPQHNGNFAAVFAVLSTTALLSYTMPFKLGLPTRIYLVKEYLGLSVKRIVYVLAVDGSMNLTIWGLFGAGCAVYLLPSSYLSNHLHLIAVGVSLLLLVAYLGRRPLYKIVKPLLERESRIPTKKIFLSATILVADVIGFGLRHLAIFIVLGFQINHFDAFLIGVLSVFAGIASTLPMGLGAYDATLIFLLTRFGVPLELATLSPIVNRTLNLLSSMLFGGASSLYLMRTTTEHQSDSLTSSRSKTAQ